MKKFFQHETAFVENNVHIGDNSKIWHYCQVREGAVLGRDVSLGKGVFIDKDVKIGDGSRIQNGVSVYHGVRIREWVFIGPNVTFTNDRFPRAGARQWKLSETILMPGCSIGAGSIINCDITIGSFALVGAGSVVTESIPPFHMAYGLPSRLISKICACGTKKLDWEAGPDQLIQECCPQKLNDESLELAKKEIKRIYA
jgi:acetyltransferase-like isoleucine patch superfamily enzyme